MSGRITDPRETADAAAAAWLLRHEDGMAADEAGQFAAWLTESPVNADAWAQAQALWASFDMAPDPLLLSMQQSARSMRRPIWRVPAFQGAAMAASILLCLGLIGWNAGVAPGSRTPPAQLAAAADRYETGVKRSEVILKDGSHVLLDAHSSISVKLSDSRRDIALLDGEAFFRVVHDPNRPFVVSAGSRTVTATGTAFSVSITGNGMSVILEQGSVTVAKDEVALARLVPGQAYAASAEEAGTVVNVDPDSALAWRAGYLELHNMTIADAVARMNRYTEKPVIVGDPQAGALRVTGRFRTDPVRFVETLAELYPVRIRRNPDGSLAIVSVRSGKQQ